MGMGNPLLDITADPVTQELLDKYDVKLDSAILAEEKHIPIYEDIVKNFGPVGYTAGGATQNSIRVGQWMLGKAGAGSTAFIGCVGDDAYGEQLANSAAADGVVVDYMKDPTTPTGTCAVLVKDGERSLVANLASANNFKPSHLEKDSVKEIIESSKIFYMAGFFLTVSVESMETVAKHAVANNKTFCVNMSAPFIIDFFTDALAKAIEYADYVFCNESEAATYGKKYELGEDLKEIALKVAALPSASKNPRTVIFTQGSQSTIVAKEGTVTEYAVEPLSKDLLVDTNGAGDAFVGGFLAGLVNKKEFGDCVKAGHWAARTIIQNSGCTFPEVCEYKM
mmetsp:Transcript_29794/g.68378  ORF Transcript_29794/g.68378 Transcript_29794/m.68378 type:complete len:338 (+) Transcript_29794:277-1290(+)